MDWLVKIALLVFQFHLIFGAEWKDPFIKDPQNQYVTFKTVGENFEVILEEEQKDVAIGILTFDGEKDDLSLVGTHLARLGTQLDCDGTQCQLIVIIAQDADTDIDFSTSIQIKFQNTVKIITLKLKNIDDNAPVISGTPKCVIDEDEGGVGDSTCVYFVSDLDNLFDGMEIKFNDDVIEETKNIFEFRIDSAPAVNKQKKIILRVLKALDYDLLSIYVFNIYAVDGGNNQSNDFQVAIEVKDIPNKDPIWDIIDTIKTVIEHEPTNIQVKAIDGDFQVNEKIIYSIKEVDPLFEDLITIREIADGRAEIVVGDIERDGVDYFVDNNAINVILLATEEDSRAETPATIVLIIQDIDDNPPKIELNPKMMEICEHANELPTDYTLQINDIDLGENARYTVALFDKEPQHFKYSEAFRIVPGSGYQKLDFLLMVANTQLLDYDASDEWHDFSFIIRSSANVGDKKWEEEMNIKLVNWNDEPPKFVENVYKVKVKETEDTDFEVVLLSAADADGPFQIDFVLNSLTNILKIESKGVDSASVTTRGRVFDFETQPLVIFQVDATDSFPVASPPNNCPTIVNRAYATVEVTVEDVNDETPILTVIIKEDITVDENRPDGTPLDLKTNTITATDKDANANLEFTINWVNSRATKSGKVVTWDWKECLGVKATPTLEKEFKIEFYVIEKEIANTPDFEKLDTMYIVLTVTDTETEYGSPSAEATITITVNDLNDVEPEFVQSTLVGKRVQEKSGTDISIGTITAIDEDTPILTYTIAAKNPPEDRLVKIGVNSGDLFVDTAEAIDADSNKELEEFTFTVTVSDGDHDISTELKIYIIDINDKPPVFGNIPVDVPVKVRENIAMDEEVFKVDATDDDRDAPNNLMVFALDTINDYFAVSSTGDVLTKAPIDAENMPNTISVRVRVTDLNGFGTVVSQVLEIEILDENDVAPVLNNFEIKTSEEHGADVELGKLDIFDNDRDKENCMIEPVKILKVTRIDTGEIVNDHQFYFEDPIQNSENWKRSTAVLKRSSALKNFYGEFNFDLELSDGKNVNSQILLVNVDLFDFVAPKFDFPLELKYYMKQPTDHTMPLMTIGDVVFEQIRANDQQGNKYSVELEMTDAENIFAIAVEGISPQTLRLTRLPTVGQEYSISFTARNKGGNVNNVAEAQTILIFVDENEEPSFSINAVETTMEENSLTVEPYEFDEASYSTNLPFPIYYILKDNERLPFHFENPTKPILSLKQALDRERVPEYFIEVISSKSPAGPTNPTAESTLRIHVKVGDVNDNPPQFVDRDSAVGIMVPNSIITSFVTVKAVDPDINDNMIYEISAVESVDGAPLNGKPALDVFQIDESTGSIKVTIDIPSNAVGYYLLTLKVTDGDDDHYDTASLKVFIVTEKHRIEFHFNNTIDEVRAKREEALSLLMRTFEPYSCNAESEKPASEGGVAIESETILPVHFIDLVKAMPVLKEEIINKASTVQVYQVLNNGFRAEGLLLISFANNIIFPENMEEVYRVALICVAVVLSIILAILFASFIFKVRQLRQQINKLTNRKFGSMNSLHNRTAAPNTNTHTHDGANPIFVNEKQIESNYHDTASISSGDSDLVGVENNPVFAKEKF